jgi:hypothetical protein
LHSEHVLQTILISLRLSDFLHEKKSRVMDKKNIILITKSFIRRCKKSI